MTWFVSFLLFLVFVDDTGLPYTEYLWTPFTWVQSTLLTATPVKIRPFDFALIAVLIAASLKKEKTPQVAPMRTALLTVVGTTVVFYMYGLYHGGDARAASWQVYLILSTVLLAFTVSAAFRKPADYILLGKWLLAAGVYRAAVCWISYFTWARHYSGKSGAFLTSHDDTITWVVGIIILIVDALDRRSVLTSFRNFVLATFFAGAIQFNSRRLAWVSLVMGLIVLYFLFPQGKAKRRINRAALMALPLLLVYVVVGWGRPNPIFRPLRSLSTVSTQEDASTLARNAENLGLITTSNASSLALGTGWGKPYIYLTLKYDISSAFDLWQYVPHNSILGLLAFTGFIGFAGFWLVIPTAVFLNARLARLGVDSKTRNIALVGAAQIVVCANQLYGDMGIFFLRSMYALSISYAIAMRLPPIGGVWNTAKSRPTARAG